MPRYKVADIVFTTNHLYNYTPKMMAKYAYDGKEPSEFTVVMTQELIDGEKLHSGGANFPDAYLESLALYRKLCNFALNDKQGIIFHSSAVAVDGQAYLFTAPSGTGKSTHARLWRELLGDKAVMINDDKPIIRFVDGGFFVYGTPWNGKHHLDSNGRAKIKAICEIKRAENNSIKKVAPSEMILTVMNQTLRPEDCVEMDKLLSLLDKMLKSVDLYKLECNMDISAAELSYRTMSGR